MTNDSLLEKTIAAAKEVSIDNGITVVLKLEYQTGVFTLFPTAFGKSLRHYMVLPGRLLR